jgi:hypothetical protein
MPTSQARSSASTRASSHPAGSSALAAGQSMPTIAPTWLARLATP